MLYLRRISNLVVNLFICNCERSHGKNINLLVISDFIQSALE